MAAGFELCPITDRRHQSCGRDDADTWDRRQALTGLLGTMPRLQFALECSYGFLHHSKLGNENAQRFTGNSWKPGIFGILNDRNQVLDPRRALARDHPQLTAMSSYGVDEHRPLFD